MNAAKSFLLPLLPMIERGKGEEKSEKKWPGPQETLFYLIQQLGKRMPAIRTWEKREEIVPFGMPSFFSSLSHSFLKQTDIPNAALSFSFSLSLSSSNGDEIGDAQSTKIRNRKRRERERDRERGNVASAFSIQFCQLLPILGFWNHQ